MVAPPCEALEASPALSLSSDRNRPASPEFRTKASPACAVPSTSSENRRESAGQISLVVMIVSTLPSSPVAHPRYDTHAMSTRLRHCVVTVILAACAAAPADLG